MVTKGWKSTAGVGTVHLKLNMSGARNRCKLMNVHYITNLCFSLLSVEEMIEHGFRVRDVGENRAVMEGDFKTTVFYMLYTKTSLPVLR